MIVVKFLVFVSEVASIFSKILTWIIGGAKGYLCPPTQLLGGRAPGCPPTCKSTPMLYVYAISRLISLSHSGYQPPVQFNGSFYRQSHSPMYINSLLIC